MTGSLGEFLRSKCPRLARRAAGLVMLLLLAGACAPRPITIPEAIPSQTAQAPAPLHAAEIRFGLIGQFTHPNVWALFSGQEYSYNTYAVRSAYWPRLYSASNPNQAFEPVLAGGPPDEIRQEGTYYTATVPVRNDLRWSDGTSFTAQDVSFTVNTVLKFELGFDWGDAYDPEWLDHAEAPAPDSVKFYFRRAPSVDKWQYGALQGPVVQEAFWSQGVAAAAEALPPDELHASMVLLKDKIAASQQQVNQLYAALLSAQGEQARGLQADLKRQQGNLDEATNDLMSAEATVKAGLEAARLALFAGDDAGEPLLGPWLPESPDAGLQIGARIVNLPNPDFPGPVPNFDRAVYLAYEAREAADRALAAGEINGILDPLASVSDSSTATMTSPTRHMRFLVFNLDSPILGDAAFRRALTCMLDQDQIAGVLAGAGIPLSSFVAPQDSFWYTAGAPLPCAASDAHSRLAQAVEILKPRGYTWEQEPSGAQAGKGFAGPRNAALPRLHLLAPASDEARVAAARQIEQDWLLLGIPVSLETVPEDIIDYAVLSSGEYDMALLGWSVSAYPGYLCKWFGPGGAFAYDHTSITSQCGELAATSDLERAREIIHQMQKTLADEVPMVPLYAVAVGDNFRNLSYPFTALLDGLTGSYGAPALAVPTAP